MNTAPRPTKWIVVFLAIFLAGFGLLFLVAAGQGNAMVRIVIGVFCLAGAGALIYLSKMQPVEHTHVHEMKLDMPGEVNMKGFKCTACGAALDSKSVSVVAGAVHVNCPYCGSTYQFEEEPKW